MILHCNTIIPIMQTNFFLTLIIITDTFNFYENHNFWNSVLIYKSLAKKLISRKKETPRCIVEPMQ
jgi:hypothetical protein